eukprot:PhF_6_TR44121/c1_g3_i3/m.67355
MKTKSLKMGLWCNTQNTPKQSMYHQILSSKITMKTTPHIETLLKQSIPQLISMTTIFRVTTKVFLRTPLILQCESFINTNKKPNLQNLQNHTTSTHRAELGRLTIFCRREKGM